MSKALVITREEQEVVRNVAAGFMRKMKWNPRWELDDIRQELLIYWCQKKQNGWKMSGEWKGAMGRCLLMYLVNIQQKECAQKRHADGAMLSLDKLIGEGVEFPDHRPAVLPLDFLDLLGTQEREICELLIRGHTKTEISAQLKISRSCVHERIMHIRKLCEEFL